MGQQRDVVVGRLDVEGLRAARVAGRRRVPVRVERVVEADPVHAVALGPVAGAIQDNAHVLGLLHLAVVRTRTAQRVASVLESDLLDGLVGCGRVSELERAADELRAAGECPGVDERLVVPLVHVHVPDVHYDRRDGEEHRDEQREEHDDLSEFVADAGRLAFLRRSPFIRPPQDVSLLILHRFGPNVLADLPFPYE